MRLPKGLTSTGTPHTRTPTSGTNWVDERIAIDHVFPSGVITASDAAFTPDAPYPTHGDGLYNMDDGIPRGDPTTAADAPDSRATHSRLILPFNFGPYVSDETCDSFFRYEDLFYDDG